MKNSSMKNEFIKEGEYYSSCVIELWFQIRSCPLFRSENTCRRQPQLSSCYLQVHIRILQLI